MIGLILSSLLKIVQDIKLQALSKSITLSLLLWFHPNLDVQSQLYIEWFITRCNTRGITVSIPSLDLHLIASLVYQCDFHMCQSVTKFL